MTIHNRVKIQLFFRIIKRLSLGFRIVHISVGIAPIRGLFFDFLDRWDEFSQQFTFLSSHFADIFGCTEARVEVIRFPIERTEQREEHLLDLNEKDQRSKIKNESGQWEMYRMHIRQDAIPAHSDCEKGYSLDRVHVEGLKYQTEDQRSHSGWFHEVHRADSGI